MTIVAGAIRAGWIDVLSAVLELCCGEAQLMWHRQTPWSSATFSGARHEIALRFDGAEAAAVAEAVIEAIGEFDPDLPGLLVGDAAIGSVLRRAGDEPETIVQLNLLVLENS